MNNFWSGIVTILVAIIGVAVLATLVSRNARTPEVLTSAGNAFAKMLGAATAPVSGGGFGGGYSMGGF